MKNYTKTDQIIHLLSQTIAKANRTFVPSKKDDSHTNIHFDFLGKRILGRWIETPKGKVMLTLNLPELKFEWLNDSFQVVNSVDVVGKAVKDIELELVPQLTDLEMSSEGFLDKLHYDIPEYAFALDAFSSIDPADMNSWMQTRNQANIICDTLLGHLQVASETRIWPHHFDTGIYAEVNENRGIGFGLAMEDAMGGDAYYYIAGYALKGDIDFSSVPTLDKGKWEIGENWKGAFLPINAIQNESDLIEFTKATLGFYLA